MATSFLPTPNSQRRRHGHGRRRAIMMLLPDLAQPPQSPPVPLNCSATILTIWLTCLPQPPSFYVGGREIAGDRAPMPASSGGARALWCNGTLWVTSSWAASTHEEGKQCMHEGPKTVTRRGVNGTLKFLSELLTIVPSSNPKKQTHLRMICSRAN